MRKFVKCVRCNWRFGNIYHCCYVDSGGPRIDNESVATGTRRHRDRETRRQLSPMHREAISEAQKDRMHAFRELNKQRDVAIVERYNQGGIGYEALGRQFGVSRSTVISIMKRAQAAGVTTPRPAGLSVKHGAV